MANFNKIAIMAVLVWVDMARNMINKLGLSCAKLRASLFFSGLDDILVYID